MADTERTIEDLLTNLFKDGQPPSSITPQDMRDLIVSMAQPHGSINFTAASATPITVAGTYYKALGSTAATGHNYGLNTDTDNRIIYTGTPERHFWALATVSVTCAGNNKIVGGAFAKNGSVLSGCIARNKLDTGSDIKQFIVMGDIKMVTDDYLELFVTNEDSTDSVTVQNGCIWAVGLTAHIA